MKPHIEALACAFMLTACGGSTSDGTNDAGADSPCVSASRAYAVCNGPNACFTGAPSSQCEYCSSQWDPTKVGMCFNTGLSEGFATDGQLYVEPVPEAVGAWDPYPFELGELFADNGATDRVRYADWAEWDGATLPEPTACPTFTNYRVCGGNCNGCMTGETCTGRSPNHPYGICLLNGNGRCGALQSDGGYLGCAADQVCFTFQSTSSGQATADIEGLCMSTAGCQEALTTYPGGGFCHATN